MKQKIELYDTTLRDGAQGRQIKFSAEDQLRVVRALDDFGGSMALAAAAYNAGPGRPRSWRNGPLLDGAIWAENVPFHETRDYVKKVLSNATIYAALLSGQPQSLKARLGNVGPREASAGPIDAKMP